MRSVVTPLLPALVVFVETMSATAWTSRLLWQSRLLCFLELKGRLRGLVGSLCKDARSAVHASASCGGQMQGVSVVPGPVELAPAWRNVDTFDATDDEGTGSAGAVVPSDPTTELKGVDIEITYDVDSVELLGDVHSEHAPEQQMFYSTRVCVCGVSYQIGLLGAVRRWLHIKLAVIHNDINIPTLCVQTTIPISAGSV